MCIRYITTLRKHIPNPNLGRGSLFFRPRLKGSSLFIYAKRNSKFVSGDCTSVKVIAVSHNETEMSEYTALSLRAELVHPLAVLRQRLLSDRRRRPIDRRLEVVATDRNIEVGLGQAAHLVYALGASAHVLAHRAHRCVAADRRDVGAGVALELVRQLLQVDVLNSENETN